MPDFGRWTPSGGDPSLNEINRTDRFLDALATEQPVYATDAGEADLISLLSGWRDEIREAPLSVPVTPRDAVIALDSAQRTRHRSRRTLTLVGSTAAAVLCLGGFASVVAGSGPGDSLYGLRTMIFGEQQAATRDDAVMLASQQLAEVQQLVDEGQWDAAQQKLQTLTTTVATVDDDARKQELVSQWQDLTVKVEAENAAATLPPDVPPPSFPEVVVLQTPTSSDTTSAETTAPSSPTSSDTTSPTSPTSSATTTPSSATPTTSPPPGPTTPPTSAPQQLPPVTTTVAPPVTTTVALPPPSTLPQTVAPPSSVVTPTVEVPPSSVAEEPPLTTTAVIEQQEAPQNVPTAPQKPATVEAPPTVQAPPPVREAPKTAVTTIIEAPEPDSGGPAG
jgi:hypothetical protein